MLKYSSYHSVSFTYCHSLFVILSVAKNLRMIAKNLFCLRLQILRCAQNDRKQNDRKAFIINC